MTALIAQVGEALATARHVYAGTPAAPVVDEIERRLHEPLRVAIAGKVKAGKSTLLNALVGEPLAATDEAECTKVVTWYVQGRRYRAVLEPVAGEPFEVAVNRTARGIRPDLAGHEPDDVARLIVEWPSSRLRTMTLIDTPGVGALSGFGRHSIDLLASDDDTATAADAVIYLTPHLHPGDVRFLEAFHDDANARATPVNALAVISRADEIGGGRPDAMRSAAQVARRYAREPSLRRLCQTVVPVAGLLAAAAATLTEDDMHVFNLLARLPDDDAEALLLTAERFAAARVDDAGLEPARRVALLDRYGIFGVRLARGLVRHARADTAPRLATELRARSGVENLERLLATRFAARRDVLKARSALLAVGALAHGVGRDVRDARGVDGLRAHLERVQAGAHELNELRVLTRAAAGELPMDGDALDELQRTLSSGDPTERLGVADRADVGEALIPAIERWRVRAAHPLASPAVVDACAVVVRSLEGMLVSDGFATSPTLHE